MGVTQITYRCGHQGEAIITGRDRQGRIDRLQALDCIDCQTAAYDAEHAAELARGVPQRTIHVYTHTETEGRSFTQHTRPVTLSLERLSPTARAIAEAITSTASVASSGEFRVALPDGTTIWRIPAGRNKYYGLASVYRMLERVAADLDSIGGHVIGPAWEARV